MEFVIKPYQVNQFMQEVNAMCLRHGISPSNQAAINQEGSSSTVVYNGVFIARLTPEQLSEIRSIAASL